MVNQFLKILSEDNLKSETIIRRTRSNDHNLTAPPQISVAQRTYIKQKLKDYTEIQSTGHVTADEFNEAHSIYPRLDETENPHITRVQQEAAKYPHLYKKRYDQDEEAAKKLKNMLIGGPFTGKRKPTKTIAGENLEVYCI